MGVNRRRVLATGAALTTGGIALAINPDQSKAQATTSIDGLSIPDKEVQSDNFQDVTLAVDASWSFTCDYNVDRTELILAVGQTEGKYPVDRVETTESLGQSANGTTSLKGSIVETPAFSIEQFNLDDGESGIRMAVKLFFRVYKDGEKLVETTASEDVTITVIGGEISAEATVGGSGEVVFS